MTFGPGKWAGRPIVPTGRSCDTWKVVSQTQILLSIIALIVLELYHLKWIWWEYWDCRSCGTKNKHCGGCSSRWVMYL